jgi:hypothetical protein
VTVPLTEEITERYLEIREVKTGRVVTVVEVLSPKNKRVCERAKYTCEYCLMPEIAVFVSHEIDHVTAEKHGRQTNEHNLALRLYDLQ